ncbi:MAG: KpsF/GutQ family sugar-phosphate isomerase, partial [Bacteroidales bacterium]|nr:KpsF/GutQ family sugar-phosphate isomerase [Bacteroidales bacterium]
TARANLYQILRRLGKIKGGFFDGHAVKEHTPLRDHISKSGNTPEIKVLVPLIRRMGNKLIAMVSNTESYLALHSDYVIRATVDEEACPNNLAPTSSTTTQLVMGDALAVCLLKMRGFSPEDFAKYHPGGSLGKRLYLTVDDVYDKELRPWVSPDETIQNTIINISQNRLGATVVLDKDEKLLGIITDGDVRRMVEKGKPLDSLVAMDIMSRNPKVVEKKELAVNAFSIMEKNKITSVIVLDEGKYVGLIHIHDVLREGIV